MGPILTAARGTGSAQAVTLAAVFSKMTAEDIVLAVVGNLVARCVKNAYVGDEGPEEVMELAGQLLQTVKPE